MDELLSRVIHRGDEGLLLSSLLYLSRLSKTSSIYSVEKYTGFRSKEEFIA